MNISYEGIGHMSVTFPAGECEAGKVCELDEQGCVVTASEGNHFIGLVESVKDGRAAVQLHGFAKVTYSGMDVSLGFDTLCADADGNVAVSGDGKTYLVVQVDAENKTAVIEL